MKVISDYDYDTNVIDYDYILHLNVMIMITITITWDHVINYNRLRLPNTITPSLVQVTW